MFNRLHSPPNLSNLSLRKAFIKDNLFSLHDNYLIHTSPCEAIELHKEHFSHLELIAVKFIYGLFEQSREVFFSQKFMSEHSDIRHRTIERVIKKLKLLGFLRLQYRNRRTNKYYINSALMAPHIKNPLKRFLSNVKKIFIPTTLLIPSSIGRGGVLILNENFINNPSVIGSPSKHVMRAKGVDLPGSGSDSSRNLKKGGKLNKDSLELIENSLDRLPLTTRGICKLAVFPLDTIKKLLTKKLNFGAQDIFAYIWSIARKETDGSFKIDFTEFDRVSKAMNMTNEPYIDADRLQRAKELQQREMIKQPCDAKGFSKQTARSFGNAAPAWSSDDTRIWSNEQKRIEMKDFCETIERYGMTTNLSVKSKYDELKALLMQYPVSENDVRVESVPTSDTVSRNQKMVVKCLAEGIDPEGLSYFQMNRALAGRCFCCVVKRSNGNNKKCILEDCHLKEKPVKASPAIVTVVEKEPTIVSDNFMQNYSDARAPSFLDTDSICEEKELNGVEEVTDIDDTNLNLIFS